MRKLTLLCALALCLPMAVRAQGCTVPGDGPAAPSAGLAKLAEREVQLVLSEYMYVHRWTRHSEALAAGFRVGDQVYGETLKRDGRFDPARAAAWRKAHEQADHAEFARSLKPRVSMATVNAAAVTWMLEFCQSGLWSRVRPLDECRFEFAAGLARSQSVQARPIRFAVRGGQCTPWLAQPLSAKGRAVQCTRSGDATTLVILSTDRAGTTAQQLAPLPPAARPPEPRQEARLAEPVVELIRLTRASDYRLRQLGKGCPTCALYSAEIRPTDPDATILNAATVSSNGVGWQRCPADLRCGVYEFSPPDEPGFSGCVGRNGCRVWRLAEMNAEASDVIQLTTQRSELACVNCPAGTDFESAHKAWQQKVAPKCRDVPDLPPQTMDRVSR